MGWTTPTTKKNGRWFKSFRRNRRCRETGEFPKDNLHGCFSQIVYGKFIRDTEYLSGSVIHGEPPENIINNVRRNAAPMELRMEFYWPDGARPFYVHGFTSDNTLSLISMTWTLQKCSPGTFDTRHLANPNHPYQKSWKNLNGKMARKLRGVSRQVETIISSPTRITDDRTNCIGCHAVI